MVIPLATGPLTSYGRATPRWWKKRVSWSRGKRHGHPDNHLWKQGKKKEEKVVGTSPAYLGPIFVSEFCPKLCSPPLPSHIQELTTPFLSPTQSLIFPLVHEPFLNELLSSVWFRSVRPRFEYQFYFLCDLDHDTFQFSSPQFPQLLKYGSREPLPHVSKFKWNNALKVVSFSRHWYPPTKDHQEHTCSQSWVYWLVARETLETTHHRQPWDALVRGY